MKGASVTDIGLFRWEAITVKFVEMAKRMVLLVVTALAGCSFSSKLNGTTYGGSQPGTTSGGSTASGNGRLIIPALTGKTAAEADAVLRAAGFTFDRVAIDDHLCGGDDDKMVAQETVCDQRPAAGSESGARLIGLTVTIQHDTYEHGGVGGPSEWRRMPDLVGKPIDVARTVLARANLPIDAEFEVIEKASDDCQPDQVCGTEPEPRSRKVLGRRGRLYVGKAQATTTPATKPATGETYF